MILAPHRNELPFRKASGVCNWRSEAGQGVWDPCVLDALALLDPDSDLGSVLLDFRVDLRGFLVLPDLADLLSTIFRVLLMTLPPPGSPR